MSTETFTQIDSVLSKAIQCIENGEFKKAEKLRRSLQNSWAVSEAERASAIITGYSLYTRQKKSRAKEHCLQRICYLWDNPDGLFFIRQPHPAPTKGTFWYELQVTGGCAQLGAFTQFTQEHKSSFLVLANAEFQAIKFIEEVANYAHSDEKEVALLAALQLDEGQHSFDKLGVYRCSPFTTSSKTTLTYLGGESVPS